MLKAAARPSLGAAASNAAESMMIIGQSSRSSSGAGPSCHLSTGSHPIHSTALLRAKLRRDTEARKEWFGPGGIGEAHRHLMTFGEYAKRREAAGSRREMMADIRAQLASTSASAAFSTSTRSSASTSQRGGSSGSYRREDVVHTTLPALLTTFESMTKQGQRPTRKAYLELLQAAAEYSNEREAVRTGSGDNTDGHPSLSGSGGSGNDTGLGWKIAWSAWEDARLGGLELGIEAFDLLVKAAMPHPRLIPSLLYYAQANPYLYAQLSEETYDRLLRTPALQSNLETTLALMTEMRRAGHRPSSDRMNQAAKMACEWDQPKVALDLCERLEREVGGGAQAVEAQTWLEVLRCSARNQFVAGVERGWERTRTLLGSNFAAEEGLLLLMMNVVARHGLDSLGSEVLQELVTNGVKIREHHLAPMLDAFCHNGKISDAMDTLAVMRQQGMCHPTLETAEPIVRLVGQSTDLLDSAFFALETLRREGRTVDIAAFNAVIKAAEALRDLPRAMAIYTQAQSLGVRPSTETYNVLLSACVATRAKDQGLRLIAKMDSEASTKKQTKQTEQAETSEPLVPFNSETFERVIELCLTQTKYDDAFHWLDKMKQAKLRVPLTTYEALVRKCIDRNDKRYRAVLEEMQLGNYKPSNKLVEYVKKNLAQIRARSEGS